MPGCAALNCSNQRTPDCRLFRFPTDVKRTKQWLKNMQRGDWTPTVHSRICQVHFADSAFETNRADGNRKLRPDAVPTIFNNETNLKNKSGRKKLYNDSNREVRIVYCCLCNEETKNYKNTKKEGENTQFGLILSILLGSFQVPIPQLRNECCHACGKTVLLIFETLVDLMVSAKLASRFNPGVDLPKNVLYNCDLCDNVSSTQQDFSEHFVSHVLQKGKSSRHQSKTFKESTSIPKGATHEAEVQKDHGYSKSDALLCHLCGMSVRSPTSLQRHLKTHVAQTYYVPKPDPTDFCFECGAMFLEKEELDTHMAAMHPPPEDTMETSPNMLTDEAIDLTEAESVVGGYQCDICKTTYPTLTHLEDHCKDFHQADGELWFECKQCSEMFETNGLLASHLQHKHKEGTHACEVCGLALDSKDKLEEHKRREHGQPNNRVRKKRQRPLASTPHSCLDCQVAFKDHVGLTNHLVQIHGGDITELQKIKGNYENSKMFECSICHVELSYADIQMHCSMLHDGEGMPSHICRICGVECNFKTTLRDHMKKFHANYRCKFCSAGFFDVKFLRRHLTTKHNILENSSTSNLLCEDFFVQDTF